MTADDFVTAAKAHVHDLFALVDSGQVDALTAAAVAVADLIATAAHPDTPEAAREPIYREAVRWALSRERVVSAALIAGRTEIPDSPEGLDT